MGLNLQNGPLTRVAAMWIQLAEAVGYFVDLFPGESPHSVLPVLGSKASARTRNQIAMFGCDYRHRIGVLHRVGATQLGNAVFQQSQHKTGRASNEGSDWRKTILSWLVGMGYSASERLGIDAIAR